MFIVWGQKKTEKSIGYAADFCSMCREVRCFRVFRIGSASHVYYLSFGAGALVGHLARCQGCGYSMEVDATRYRSLMKSKPSSLAELERETFPDLRSAYAQRIELEESLARGPVDLPEALRRDLIREPFTNLAPIVEERYGSSSHFDLYGTLALLSSILVPVLLGVISANSEDPDVRSALGMAAMITFGIGLVVTFVLVFTEARRFVRRRILPRLARALRKLDPSRAEVEECLAQLRAVGLKLGKKVKPDDLIFLIETPEDLRVRDRLAAAGR